MLDPKRLWRVPGEKAEGCAGKPAQAMTVMKARFAAEDFAAEFRRQEAAHAGASTGETITGRREWHAEKSVEYRRLAEKAEAMREFLRRLEDQP